jgi:hypothetical protein
VVALHVRFLPYLRVSTVLSVLLDSAELLCSEFRPLLSLSETCADELERPQDHILK